MNDQLLTAFLVPVVEEACVALQLQQAGTDQIATTDRRVVLCAKAAYGMIAAYTNRQFIKDVYVEYYYEEDTRIRLRNAPVESITSVQFVRNAFSDVFTDQTLGTALVAGTDFVLRRNQDLSINTVALNSRTVQSDRVHVLVEYVGGLAAPADDATVNMSLLLQTVANYNRLPALGVATLQGNETSSRGASGQMSLSSDPNAGDLLDAVMTLLSAYVYHGSAEFG